MNNVSPKCKTGDQLCFYNSGTKKFYIFGASISDKDTLEFDLVGFFNLVDDVFAYEAIIHVESYQLSTKTAIFTISELSNAFQMSYFVYTNDST